MDLRGGLILLRGCLLFSLFVQRLRKIRTGIEAADGLFICVSLRLPTFLYPRTEDNLKKKSLAYVR